MKQSHSESEDLVVIGPDEVTEIFLIDARLKRIAKGVGRLEAKVAPGLYKIRCRSGSSHVDKLIKVPVKSPSKTVRISPVEFQSSAPIAHTSTTHEYQTAPAMAESRRTHVRTGRGSQIFLFVREASEAKSWLPCEIALYDLGGSQLADLEAGFHDPYARVAGINVELDPGTYAVRVGNSDLGDYEMYLTASQGWQTQLFLSFDDFWSHGEKVRVPSIQKASLLMGRVGRGFNPGDDSVRNSELARQALMQGRDVASKELMRQLLSGKFNDPTLGIIVAHLLLARRKRKSELLKTVCGNLRKMLGEHPDLKAIELALGPLERPENNMFTVPPTFRHSWDRIIQVTRRRASWVAQEGVVAQIAADVVRAGPWLTRRVPQGVPLEQPGTTIADVSRLVNRLLEQDSERLTEIAKELRAKRLPLSSIERAVLSRTLSLSRVRDFEDLESQVRPESSKPKSGTQLLNIEAPTYAVASAVSSLANKLNLIDG